MKGLLFKPDMIKAIVELRKTVTRRLSGLDEINLAPDDWWLVAKFDDDTVFRFGNDKLDKDLMIKPRYRVGETVYIKEAHYAYGEWHKEARGWVFYRDKDMAVVVDSKNWEHALKGHIGHGWFKRTAMFMFASDARYFIQILDVRPERLQEITDNEAIKEGFAESRIREGNGIHWESARGNFVLKWDSINPKYPFDSNPWVWRYEFKLIPERSK